MTSPLAHWMAPTTTRNAPNAETEMQKMVLRAIWNRLSADSDPVPSRRDYIAVGTLRVNESTGQ